ncbi:MAG: D-alanyl-D-alanine carboxypeptidase/D-alanyl-D-alanine-endopeptidase [Gemmatimonadaceae bacterium]
MISYARLLACIALALGPSACASTRTGRGMGTRVGGGVPAHEELRSAIDSLVAASQFRNAHWGILIVDSDRGDTLYSLNAGKLFMPASNMKIVTGAVALAQLGPEFRFKTAFVARGPLRDSVLVGDLVVHGSGDPTLSDRMQGDAMVPLRQIADSLLAHNVRTIAGRLLPGDDAFPDANHGFGWSWDDFEEPYSAGVDELFMNEGHARITVRGGERAGDVVRVSVSPSINHPPVRVTAVTIEGGAAIVATPGGSIPAAPPSVRIMTDSAGALTVSGAIAAGDSTVRLIAYRNQQAAFLAALGEALRSRGINVSGETLSTALPLDTLFIQHSPVLRDILPVLEKPSQNQIAEILLKTLGLERTGVGSADSGRRVVEAQLAAWGAEQDGYVIRDGSGLSRYNYLTPETIVRVLAAIRRDTAFMAFYDALAIAGVDGTIALRMRGTPAEGNVRAKTGFIAQARSLSGYVTTSDGRVLIFSILCNNWTTPQKSVNDVQDAIAAHLASLVMASGRR